MRGLTCAAILGLAVSTALAGTISANSWRPYRDPKVLVMVGMTTAEVLAKAGPPDRSETIALAPDEPPTASVWSYVRKGTNAEVANLTFRGNELMKIELTSLQ